MNKFSLMSRLEMWLLRRIFAKAFRQGPYHARNLSVVYRLIRNVCEQEFYEDNAATLNAFLLERFEVANNHVGRKDLRAHDTDLVNLKLNYE